MSETINRSAVSSTRLDVVADRERLLTALRFTLPAIQKPKGRRGYSSIPILDCVRITVDGGLIRIESTDMDRTASIVIGTHESAASGAVCVNGYGLAKALESLPGADIHLEYFGAALRVTGSNNGLLSLETMPVDDFPTMDISGAFENAVSVKLDAAAFRDILTRAKHAISTEETRYYLNGLFVTLTSELALRMVATDGHRLTHNEVSPADVLVTARGTYKMTTDKGVEGFAGVIVPRAMIDHLLKVLPKKPGTLIRFEMNDSRVKVTSGRAVLMSKTIDGTFPEYARVIPQHNESIVRFNRVAFLDALKLVKSVADSRSFTVQLAKSEAYGLGDVLAIVAKSHEKGVASTQIAATFSGPLMPEIGFDAAYMADMLSSSLDGAEIEVALGDSTGPAVWRDASRPQGFVVLMPRRV